MTLPGLAGQCVVGLDLSLTATGIASTARGGFAEVIRPPAGLDAHQRLAWCRRAIFRGYIDELPECVVMVEGPSFGSRFGKYHERAGQWWMITHVLWRRRIPFAVVPPETLKRYVNGKAGKKAEVLVAITRLFPWCPPDDNAADALACCAMYADKLGVPMLPGNPFNRAALSGVAWPPEEGSK
jgi:Holliday junction resolvasome RuvABC endonuclease subunit